MQQDQIRLFLNGDFERRFDFCKVNMMFNDDVTFTTKGMVSSQHCRFWACVIPNVVKTITVKKLTCGMAYLSNELFVLFSWIA